MTRKRWTPTEAAHALFISDRHLRRLVSEHVLTPDKTGGFDPIPTMQGFIRHRQKDSAAKQARTALTEVETMRKRLLTRRQLGETVTIAELRDFVSAGVWGRALGAWNVCCSYLFYALRERLGDETQARVIASEAADAGLHEMHRLRDDLAAKLRDLRRDLRDDARIEGLMAELATGGQAEDREGDDD